VSRARLFPSACIATPHHLASAAGLEVLASGGNALEAAIAANLVLGVVTPYLCGYGGDLFAMIWSEGEVHAYNGSGRAPSAATVEAMRAAVGADRMPSFGPQTVTVPGAVDAWFVLLERFGTRPFTDLAQQASRYAIDGFVPSEMALPSLARGRDRYRWSAHWLAAYGDAASERRLRQPDLARTIELLGKDGPDAYYRGPIAEAIVRELRSLGSLMSAEDLADHHGDWVEPLQTGYRDVDVLEMPPNTQGVAALEALNIVEELGALPPDGPERQYLLIEATKLALADRNEHVTDPNDMRMSPLDLASKKWAAERARFFDPTAAGRPSPGPSAGGGTAYLCAADSDGMLVSLIQSNYMGFGSGVTVPEWGINLQNRGSYFSLDPTHINVIAPRKRTLHTLIPALAFRGGRPWLVFGTMGGDGQAQTHVQLLARIVDDSLDPQAAIDAPRWFVSPQDWSVVAESRFSAGMLEGLRARGHHVERASAFDSLLGHAHAIQITGEGYVAGTDPRTEGAALGL
jgi:gamma-glutamyltranspeptidase/glutathione hydrolase